MKKLLFLLIALSLYGQSRSQDVEHMFDRFKKKAFKFSGDISASQVLYRAWGNIDSRRQPYTYYLMGNLNVSVYGWNLPFSFTLSDQESEYTTPPMQDFNRFGVSPYYKWVKIHAGHRSMSFSPYTYNGYTFLGGGAELTPGIFNISGFYGRLHKAIEEDTLNNIDAVYKRMAYGFNFGIKKDALFANIILFKAADDSGSLKFPVSNLEITPGENLVVGIKAGNTFMKTIKVDIEYAQSAYTRDIRADKQTDKAPALFANVNGLFTPRVSSEYYAAYKAGLNYLGNGYGLGVGYERIDPGYQTMGAYYFNNDLENITVNANTSLFKQKLQLAVNLGHERNNLDKDKASTMRKTVSAANINFVPSPKWNIALSYSNFSSFINIRSDFDYINQVDPMQQLDTLNFTQITQSANANVSYVIGKADNADKKQFINLNLSSQIAANEQEGNPNSGSSFYNGNLSYTLNIVPRDLSITTAANGNYTEMPGVFTAMYGPMLALNKLFFEKTLRTSVSMAYNQAKQNSKLASEIVNFRINTTYSLKKKHNFNLSVVSLFRSTKTPEYKDFTECTITLGYAYSFATKDDKTKGEGEEEAGDEGLEE